MAKAKMIEEIVPDRKEGYRVFRLGYVKLIIDPEGKMKIILRGNYFFGIKETNKLKNNLIATVQKMKELED